MAAMMMKPAPLRGPSLFPSQDVTILLDILAHSSLSWEEMRVMLNKWKWKGQTYLAEHLVLLSPANTEGLYGNQVMCKTGAAEVVVV